MAADLADAGVAQSVEQLICNHASSFFIPNQLYSQATKGFLGVPLDNLTS